MSFLSSRDGIFQFAGVVGRWVDLRLETGLDHVERAGYDTCEASCCGAGEKFQRHANLPTLLVLSRPGLKLLPKHELER